MLIFTSMSGTKIIIAESTDIIYVKDYVINQATYVVNQSECCDNVCIVGQLHSCVCMCIYYHFDFTYKFS